MVIDSYLSLNILNFSAIKNQEIPTPTTSPRTVQNADTPTKAPNPVRPNNNQADSPVALAENATTQ